MEEDPGGPSENAGDIRTTSSTDLATDHPHDQEDRVVEKDVITKDTDEKISISSTDQSRPKPRPPTLPSMPSLSELQLHSPSHIIGTPFTLNSAPYEYPFPPNTHPSSSSDALLSSLTPPSLLASSLSLAPPTVAVTTNLPPFGPDARSYSPTHPKLRAVDPPVPPGLVKRRQRWSLGLERRNSSYGSQMSVGSAQSGADSESRGSPPLDDTSTGLTPPGASDASQRAEQKSSRGRPATDSRPTDR